MAGSVPAELAAVHAELKARRRVAARDAAGDPRAAGAPGNGGQRRGQRTASLRHPPVGAGTGRTMQGRAGRPCAARSRRVRRHPHAARSGGAAGGRAACRARAGEDRGGREPGAAGGRVRADGVRFPLRPRASSADHRLQRGGAPRRPELLRSAGVGGPAVQLRGDRAGTLAAGQLVCHGPPAGQRRAASRCCFPGAAPCSST